MRLDDLAARLAEIPTDQLEPPATGRVGATLVLLDPRGDDVRITYTRRQPTLSSHPGQISFPGGRVDPGESIVDAAIREAAEEIALDPASVRVVGRLPAFYIPPSRFWMSAVVAAWERPHPLVPNPAEVGEILTVPVSTLYERGRWRAVPLSASGATWAWQLAPQRLLWGATAVVTGVLLQVADPTWSDGVRPEDLPADRQVRPWEDPESAGLTPTPTLARPKLRDVASTLVDGTGPVDPPSLDRAAADVALAVRRLARRPPGPVVVLVGRGGTGRVAAAAADRLRADDPDVVVVHADDPPGGDRLTALLAGAGAVVDGLVGRGVDGPLRAPVRPLVAALRMTAAPIVAVDLPSGVHPVLGILGETASADVTVALTPLVPGHTAPGVPPFVGDLYLSGAGDELVRAEVAAPPRAWAE